MSDSMYIDLYTIVARITPEVITEMVAKYKPEKYLDFGLKSSHKYRAMLLKMLSAKGFSDKEILELVLLFTAISSRNRILAEAELIEISPKVLSFITNDMVQLTEELKKNKKKFASVHVCSSMPSIAFMCWCIITTKENLNLSNLVRNSWLAQMRVEEDVMKMQKEFEMDLWNNRVKKGGASFEDKGFNEEYWKTKVKDNYKFMRSSGKLIDRFMNSELLRDLLKEWLAIKPDDLVSSSKMDEEQKDDGKHKQFAEELKAQAEADGSDPIVLVTSIYAKAQEVIESYSEANDGAREIPDHLKGYLRELFSLFTNKFPNLDPNVDDDEWEAKRVEGRATLDKQPGVYEEQLKALIDRHNNSSQAMRDSNDKKIEEINASKPDDDASKEEVAKFEEWKKKLLEDQGTSYKAQVDSEIKEFAKQETAMNDLLATSLSDISDYDDDTKEEGDMREKVGEVYQDWLNWLADFSK